MTAPGVRDATGALPDMTAPPEAVERLLRRVENEAAIAGAVARRVQVRDALGMLRAAIATAIAEAEARGEARAADTTAAYDRGWNDALAATGEEDDRDRA